MKRREFWMTSLCAAAAAAAPRPALAEDVDQRLRNRLELWTNYAARTENLVSRFELERHTSLTESPVHATGTMVFSEASSLVFVGDGSSGIRTEIGPALLRLTPRQEQLGDPRTLPQSGAAAWLADVLVRIFGARTGDALTNGLRARAPRSRGAYRLELLPPRSSAVRQILRSVTVVLDPVAGAVLQVEISEAQGDRVQIKLTDHRQNVDDATLNAALR